MANKLKHLVMLLLIFGCFFTISWLIRDGVNSYGTLNGYATSDVTYADGSTAHSDSNNFGLVNEGDTVVVHVYLPEALKIPNAVICFDLYHSMVEVKYHDVVLADRGKDVVAKGDMIGYEAYFVQVPDEAWGDTLDVILRPTEPNAYTRLQHIQVYPAQDAFRFYFNIEPVRFIVSVPMFLLSVFFLILVLLLHQDKKLRYQGICFALCLLFLSAYMAVKSEIPYMLLPNTGLWSLVEFGSAAVVSYPLLFYVIMRLRKGKARTLLQVLFNTDLVFMAVITALHLTNIVHYCVTLPYAHILTGINAVIIMTYSIKYHDADKLSWRIRSDTFVLAALCGLLDTTRNTILNYTGFSMPSVLHFGLLSMISGMILSYIIELTASQKKAIASQIKTQSLEKILNEIPAGICVIDLANDGHIMQANKSFYEMGGYSVADAAHAGDVSLYDRVVERQRGWLRRIAEQVKDKSGTIPGIETNVLCKDGTEIDTLGKCFINRETMTATINVIDITERKRAEKELKVSEERYRLALTQSGKVFFFFDVPTKTMHLSAELAQQFGLPKDVDNMPDNFLAHRLVEPRSVQAYRDFYEKIYRGDPGGSTVISCHMPQHPKEELWYRITFTTVFDEKKNPKSAIITYEDINEQHQSEIANAWRPQNLLAVPEREWVIAEYNLSQNTLLRQTGGLFGPVPVQKPSYDEIGAYAVTHYVADEDREKCTMFLDRTRLLQGFEKGMKEDSMEYRATQGGTTSRWTRTSIQLIRDPYSEDILAQMLFQDINVEKTGQLEMQHSMEELKKELENSRIRIMINQMQPHFLYNALSAIQTIVKTDPDYAYQLIYDFTVHLRASIKALSSDRPIPFTDELKNIKAYLNIEQMRFGDKLKIQYDIQCKDFKVIPLSIQPLAENAARHGVYPRGDAGGTITIRTYETLSAYVVEVEDDGVGFDVEEVMKRQGDSIGLKNMMFRMKSLMNAEVAVESHINKGTKATVTIPIETEPAKKGETNENDPG